ncbi:MAG: aminoacyl-tRNA hydrolase [Bifidobacteriaceae bacterium]|nr:aminoacyl-tRNA hydrolase [Bifidobacteriaceae bacterium]
MFLVAGLGNPGRKFFYNRHNIGFQTADSLAEKYGAKFKQTKFSADLTDIIKINDVRQIMISKPVTFMNDSGLAIQKIMSFYKILPEKVIIVHDDIDLEFADIRVKLGGSDAGHNGLRSITQAIGKNYYRVRIGVGRPKYDRCSVLEYVLGDFAKSEKVQLRSIIENAQKEILQILLA